MRAERTTEPEFFTDHGIAHRQYRVPDVTVPEPDVLTDAVAWLDDQLADGRRVLIHCAKGRGRSATVLAAYLMRTEGLSFDEVSRLLRSKRRLVKLQDRHRVVLEAWIAAQPAADAGAGQALIPRRARSARSSPVRRPCPAWPPGRPGVSCRRASGRGRTPRAVRQRGVERA